MTAPTPDIAGFLEAQERMREEFGRDVAFNVPVAATWPADTQLDENGEPYDPTVVPTSGGGTAPSVIHVGVVRQALPTNEEDEVDRGPGGVRSTERAVLIVAPPDYLTVQPAVSFELDGIAYTITDMTPDGIVGTDRWLVFGEAS
jgi:hypothetical protein